MKYTIEYFPLRIELISNYTIHHHQYQINYCYVFYKLNLHIITVLNYTYMSILRRDKTDNINIKLTVVIF